MTASAGGGGSSATATTPTRSRRRGRCGMRWRMSCSTPGGMGRDLQRRSTRSRARARSTGGRTRAARPPPTMAWCRGAAGCSRRVGSDGGLYARPRFQGRSPLRRTPPPRRLEGEEGAGALRHGLSLAGSTMVSKGCDVGNGREPRAIRRGRASTTSSSRPGVQANDLRRERPGSAARREHGRRRLTAAHDGPARLSFVGRMRAVCSSNMRV